MNVSSKRIPLSKPILSLSSIILGYSFWLILAQTQTIILDKKISLSFYGLESSLTIANYSQQEIYIKISGKRIELSQLTSNQIIAHIDVSNLKEPGNFEVEILKENIFLQDNIKLLEYSPSNLTIQINKKEK